MTIAQQEIDIFVDAALEGNLATLQALYNTYGKAILDLPHTDGATALTFASSMAVSDNLFTFLLAAGANVNLAGMDGYTPLICAMLWMKEDRIPLLLAAGANVGAHDQHGRTTLHLACNMNKPSLIPSLIGAGADVNALSFDLHYTPLMEAATLGHTGCAAHLLNTGKANPCLKSTHGKTAAQLAAGRGFSSLAATLRQAEAQWLTAVQQEINLYHEGISLPSQSQKPLKLRPPTCR